ncbi:MAG: acetyl-CoA acetyltransferase [Acidobacteriota bacterium]
MTDSSQPLDTTPVLVGGGQAVLGDLPDLEGEVLHPMDLCADAARRALDEAGAKGDLAAALQSITVVRMFEDSGSRRMHEFGRSSNPPRSVARRIGADPAEAVYSSAGGATPQSRVNQLAERIARGELEAALLCGVENIATVVHAMRNGAELDFEEDVEGSLVDEGFGDHWFDKHQLTHRFAQPVHCYPLLEHAIRAERGHSVEEHLRHMAELFAPFSEVAAANPYAYRAQAYSVDDLTEPTGRNRFIGYPYGRLLNARDRVDQSSAAVLLSVSKARELGVPRENWVFLNGCSDVAENKLLLERPLYQRSEAARLMGVTALEMAGLGMDDMASIDLYSCFPSAVEIVTRELGLAEDDPRGLTTTGGLPYFGGPGNSYSLHAIAEAVRRAREAPGTYHWVSANGGNVNKQSAGIYSTEAILGTWERKDPALDQQKIAAQELPPITLEPDGEATVETFTVAFDKEELDFGLVVGRQVSDGARFLARVASEETDTLKALLEAGMDVRGRASTKDEISTFVAS